jgi:uncharacterized protein YbjT (DUF2867 family)
MKDKRILVVGGTGFVGHSVATGLMEAGYPVRILARSVDKARKIYGENADIVQGDVTDPQSLPSACAGCYGIFIAIHPHKGVENFFRVEHNGVENVANAAAQAGVRHIISVSGANVNADESAYFVRSKYLGEQALLECPVPATILRCSWFMESLPMMIRGPLAAIVGRQPHPIHFIAFNDLVRMVAKVFETPESGNKRLEAYGPETLLVHQALKKYCREFAPWAIVVHMPLWFFGIFARIAGGQFLFLHDLMALTNRSPEPADSGEAARLLGPNAMTLDEWLAGLSRSGSIRS